MALDMVPDDAEILVTDEELGCDIPIAHNGFRYFPETKTVWLILDEAWDTDKDDIEDDSSALNPDPELDGMLDAEYMAAVEGTAESAKKAKKI
jgi:hypothetical protein